MLVFVPIGHEVSLRRVPKATFGLVILMTVIFIPTYLTMHREEKQLKELTERLLSLGALHSSIADTTEGEPTGTIFTMVELHDKSTEQAIDYFHRRATKNPDQFEGWLELYSEYEYLKDHTFVAKWGFVPADFPSFGFVTSIFLHGGIFHLLFNMWFLYLTGTALEDAWGRFKYLGFFLLGGMLANYVHLMVYPQSTEPCIGASGAIAGLMGAFAVCYAREKVNMFYAVILILRPYVGTFRAPAWVMVTLWFVVQLFWALVTHDLNINLGVAYWVHVGGVVIGALFAFWLGLSPRTEKEPPPSELETVYYSEPQATSPIYESVVRMLGRGEVENAREYCQTILRQSPNNRDAHRGLCQVYLKTGDEEKARSEMLSMIERTANLGDRSSLPALYEELRELFPSARFDNPDVAYRVAMACAAQHKSAECAELLRFIIDNYKDKTTCRALALFKMAKLEYEIYNDPNSARGYFQQYIDEFPEHEWNGAARDLLRQL